MSDLTSTAGIVAIVALALGALALTAVCVLAFRLRRVRADQAVVLGESAPRDLVAQASALEHRLRELAARQDRSEVATGERLLAAERRLDRAVSRSSVVRYDAYGEMSGRQSSSIALLDDSASGILVSSILHREQARVYAKRVDAGDSELGISPEERQAIDDAMSRDAARASS